MLDVRPDTDLQRLELFRQPPRLLPLLGRALRLERFMTMCHATDLPMFSDRFYTPE